MMRKFKVLAAAACVLLSAAAVNGQEDAAKLADALSSSDVSVQRDACQKLAKLGPAARVAVPQLIKALSSSDGELQRCAALTLGALGAEAKAAVPALMDCLKSKNPKVRAYAAYALGRIGPAAQSAAAALIKLFPDKDVLVRRTVRDALRRIDAPKELTLPLMIKMLNTAEPADAAAAVLTLAELGENAVPGLCDALDHDDACYWACLALAEIGPKAESAVPNLAKLLTHKDAEVRMQALVALAEIGAASKQVAPAISKLLLDDDVEGVRYAAAYALGAIGEKKTAIRALAASLESKDEFLRVAGAWALLRLEDSETPAVKKAVQVVVKGIESDNTDVRDMAARAFADPELSKEYVSPAFRKALEGLEDDDPAKLMQVVDALSTLGPKVVPACIESLQEKRKLRFYAMRVLIKIGPDAAPAVPALMATLDDPKAELRREALFALGAIGPASAKATEKIVEKLSDADADVCHAACYALGKIGPDAQAALPSLKKALDCDDAFMKLACVWAGLKIAPDNPAVKKVAVPYLAKGLQDEREYVRVECAYALGELGDFARPAIDALKKAQNDDSPAVRAAVAEALKNLQ